MKNALILLLLSSVASVCAAPSFTSPPALVKGSGADWTVTFAVSEFTDVEVAVVDLQDSAILRRLAAGKLGPSAPAPLQANVLSQTLTWDGLDDLRRPVPAAARPAVRVRAGLSASLDRTVDASPHLFSVTINGLHTDPDGSLYVLGNTGLYNGEFGNTTMSLRKYDRNGEYLKTVFPPPAGMTPSSLTPFGALTLPGNAFRLKTYMSAGPGLGDPASPITSLSSLVCPFKINGSIMIVNIPSDNPALEFTLISPHSAFVAEAPLVTSPALPMVHSYRGPWSGGPVYLSMWPDGKSLLLTAFYQVDTVKSMTWFPADTGFWADGRAYRVDLATGVATPFIILNPAELPQTDSARKAVIGPKWAGAGHFRRMAAIHGTAFDDSGHLFLCDRLHQRVGVYDTTGAFLSSFPVTDPDLVEVDRKSGAIYVVARNITSYGGGFVHLFKYSGWRNPMLQASRLNITKGIGASSSITFQPRVSLALDTSSAVRALWIASKSGNSDAQNGFWRFEDRGDTLVQTFASNSRFPGSVPDPDRLAIDPATGTLFVQHPYANLSKIEDWIAPRLSPCSTAAGARIYASDMQVSPEGWLYLRPNTAGHGLLPNVERWTLGRRHAPAPFAGLGTNIVTDTIYEHFSNGVAAHGIDIFRDSLVAVMHRPYGGRYYVQVWDTAGTLLAESLLTMNTQCGGVQFDRAGNLYVGALCWADSHTVPDSFAGDWGYTHYVGTVIKYDRTRWGYFSPGTFSLFTGNPRQVKPQGAVRTYANTPVAPFSGRDRNNNCVCRVPRFMVDPYGRIFTANAITGRISVADNNDNLLHRFGDYGNIDSRGPGSPVPGPAIPLMWPTSAVADDDHVYVADPGNSRVLRVKMEYALNSLPGFSAAEGPAVAAGALHLGVAPNPFHPRTRLSLRLPAAGAASLKIFDSRGRCVRKLFDSQARPGVKWVEWNGRDDFGNPVAAGIYCFTLSAGNRRLSLTAVLLP